MTIRRMAALAAALITLTSGQLAHAQSAPTEIKIATEGAYAPWNFTNANGELDGLEIAMKGGQVGGDDYFVALRDGLAS